MYEKVQSNHIRNVFFIAAVAAVVFSTLFFALDANAATCENGVLKDGSGNAIATCNVTSGTGADVTCSSSGALTDSSGANVGTCAAGDLLRDGLFGCNSSKYANVGSTVALGGPYVPVNDAAVTLNTGYLVYKECILDGVTAKISGAARTQLTATLYRDINTGRKGKARFLRDPAELGELMDRLETTVILGDEFTGAMCPALKRDALVAEARRYVAERNAPSSSVACTFQGSEEDYRKAVSRGGLKEIGDLISGPNDALSLELAYRAETAKYRSAMLNYQIERLRWGNGAYDVTDENENPALEKILTPGFLVREGAVQAYTAGYRCLEGADELSEMCEKMFTEMVHESLKGPAVPGSSLGGLFGMTQAQNGLPSFVSQMVSEAAGAVRGEALNVALNNLLNIRATELAYLQAKNESVTFLTTNILRLQNTEKACWQMIAYNDQGADKHTCAALPQGKTCTAVSGGQLTIATSTQFSDAVINGSLKQLGLSVAGDAQKSQDTLKLLETLIAKMTGGNPSIQREAIAQLDGLIAANVRLTGCPAPPQKTLHDAEDAQCAAKQRTDITGAVGILVDETIRNWGDSMDVNVGWCNINNPAVIQKWTAEWKK